MRSVEQCSLERGLSKIVTMDLQSLGLHRFK